jgi:opacity protein-like surface antigen
MKRLALAIALLLLPAAAVADGDYRYELTPSVSYHFGGDLDGEGEFPFEVEVDDGVAWGLTFDVPLSSNLQLEFLVNQQDSDLFFDGGVFGPDLELSEIEITYAHVGLLVQFGRPAVSPYFVGSMGMTNLDADGRGAGSDTKFSASMGGGVKAFFTDHIGLRFEGRYFWTQLDDFDVDCDDVCYDARDYLSQFQTTVGLVFAW